MVGLAWRLGLLHFGFEMAERETITYQPALDGIRALAVAAVLLFHAEVPGFDGGYLGVSVFFTLSGYLITSLLVHEHDHAGRIDLIGFYRRRVRRLLPASVLCLGGIIVIFAVSDVFDGVSALRSQIVGSVLQVANWTFLGGEGSYQDLFEQAAGASSPLEHFWSLAIEEQFYWLWPPTMVGVLAIARTRRSRIASVGAITAIFAVAAPLIASQWGADAAYWSTPARVAEILIGALLAVVFAGRAVHRRFASLAPACLLVLAVCVVAFPPNSGPAYEGALPLLALASAGLIVGVQADGPVRTALSLGPFVWLGRISYGVYLFHWPIYVIANEQRTGLDGISLIALRLALTLAVAQLSSTLFEQPIRRASGWGSRITFGGAALSTAAVAVVAVIVIPGSGGDYWLNDAATVEAAAIVIDDSTGGALVVATTAPLAVEPVSSTSAPPPSTTIAAVPSTSVDAPGTTTATIAATTTTTEPPLPVLARPVRIMVAGDSTANATGAGLISWAAAHPDLAQVEVVGAPGCGFLLGGERRVGEWEPVPANCERWIAETIPERIRALQPDVVMLMVTSWDVLNRRWDGETLQTPLDDEYASRLATDYRAINDAVLAEGAGSIAWIRAPIPNPFWLDAGTGQDDPARHAVVYDIIESLAAVPGDNVGIVAFDQWVIDAGLLRDVEARPDGVHWDPVASQAIAEEYLGERLIRVALG